MSYQPSCFKNFQSDVLPEFLYCDTSFFVEALIRNKRHNAACAQFIKRLAEAKVILVFSTLLIAEFRCAILSSCLRDEFGSDVKIMDMLRKKPELIKQYAPIIKNAEQALNDMLGSFESWSYIPLDEKISLAAQETMFKYRLASYDAIHITTMEEWGINDIVVIDGGIEDLYHYKENCAIWTIDGYNRFKGRHPNNTSAKKKQVKPKLKKK
ncbi:MAG: PIN domain-containing protein [Candidatus Omnitrophica bacterium]|nr:PIN domain-containing protein [Candidatus Omnitrophota bacterium]